MRSLALPRDVFLPRSAAMGSSTAVRQNLSEGVGMRPKITLTEIHGFM